MPYFFIHKDVFQPILLKNPSKIPTNILLFNEKNSSINSLN